MKFLIYRWQTVGIGDLEFILRKMGHEIDSIEHVFHNYEEDDDFSICLADKLHLKQYNAVISFNYFQVISNVCNELNINYISWIFDSPTLNLFSKTVFNQCNYIFIFDKALYLEIKKMGVNHVYHLPLAVNVERLEQLDISQEDIDYYHSDISFVGSLYDKKISYDALVNLPEYYKGFLEAMMQAQLNIYGYNFLEELLTDDIVKVLNKFVCLNLGKNFLGSEKMIYANTFLGVKVTSMERMKILDILSREFSVDLYTNSDIKRLPFVNYKGNVNYYTDMPKVFFLSKINLNMTHRNIKTGIPLRIFDIMGAGGFTLTNYQEELSDYFIDGEDLVIYENMEDLQYKVRYYLENEEERKQITYNGYKKVKEFHTYRVRFEKIIETVFPKFMTKKIDTNIYSVPRGD